MVKVSTGAQLRLLHLLHLSIKDITFVFQVRTSKEELSLTDMLMCFIKIEMVIIVQ
jgi:hypothetical protein